MRLTLIILLFLAGGCSHSADFRRNPAPETFRKALAYEIEPGMTMQTVQSRLGQGELPSVERLLDLQRVIPKFALTSDEYSEGVEPDDEFLGYRYGQNLIYYLQFRDDQLINLDPKLYEKPGILDFYAVR